MENRLKLPPIVPIALNFRFILVICFLYFSSSYNTISINVNVLNLVFTVRIRYSSTSSHFIIIGFLSLGFIIISFSFLARLVTGIVNFFLMIGMGIVEK